jgi:hypothetical protein
MQQHVLLCQHVFAMDNYREVTFLALLLPLVLIFFQLTLSCKPLVD